MFYSDLTVRCTVCLGSVCTLYNWPTSFIVLIIILNTTVEQWKVKSKKDCFKSTVTVIDMYPSKPNLAFNQAHPLMQPG